MYVNHLALAQIGVQPQLALTIAPHINKAISSWGVRNVPEFVAQMAHESAMFTRLIENLNYSGPALVRTWPSRFRFYDPTKKELPSDVRFADGRHNAALFARNPRKIAEVAYSNRNGNRGPETGDAWRYIGRGYKQLTFYANYLAYKQASGVDVIQSPELLEKHEFAADSAGWFWSANKCDAIAQDIERLTRRINGGLIGLDQRAELTKRAREVLISQ